MTLYKKKYTMIVLISVVFFSYGKDFFMQTEHQDNNYTEAEQVEFEPADEQPEAPRPGPDAKEAAVGTAALRPSKKRSFLIIGITCAIIFTSLYAILNIAILKGLFSALLSVFAPVILGFAIAYMLNPILKLFEFKVFKRIQKKSLLRTLSMIATYVVLFGIITTFLLILVPQLIDNITQFTSNFHDYMDHMVELINNFVANITANEQYRSLIDEEQLIGFLTDMLFKSESLFDGIMVYVKQFGLGLIVGIKNFILALFISIYVLSSKERLKAQTAKFATAVFSPTKSRRFFKYLSLCDRTFGGFFVGMFTDSVIVAILLFLLLSVFGINYALMIATICGITNMIPFFGPFLGAIPSALIILIGDGPKSTLIFIILILVIQQIDGNIIAPKILGKSTGISSLSVIIAIIVMGEYFGIIGMLVGVPIFAVIITIITEILDTRLRKKNQSTDIAEYYSIDSLVDPREPHQSLVGRMFASICQKLSKLSRKNRKTDSKQKKD